MPPLHQATTHTKTFQHCHSHHSHNPLSPEHMHGVDVVKLCHLGVEKQRGAAKGFGWHHACVVGDQLATCTRVDMAIGSTRGRLFSTTSLGGGSKLLTVQAATRHILQGANYKSINPTITINQSTTHLPQGPRRIRHLCCSSTAERYPSTRGAPCDVGCASCLHQGGLLACRLPGCPLAACRCKHKSFAQAVVNMVIAAQQNTHQWVSLARPHHPAC